MKKKKIKQKETTLAIPQASSCIASPTLDNLICLTPPLTRPRVAGGEVLVTISLWSVCSNISTTVRKSLLTTYFK